MTVDDGQLRRRRGQETRERMLAVQGDKAHAMITVDYAGLVRLLLSHCKKSPVS